MNPDIDDEEDAPRKVQQIKPKSGCIHCRGTGEITDWVPYGSTTVPMRSFCSCVEEQIEDDDVEVEIVTAK